MMLTIPFKAYKKLSLTIIAMSLLIVSCTERIDIDLDSTYTRCVVYGEFTTDTTAHWVSVTRTGDYYQNLPPSAVSNAVVSITDGENVFMLTEDADNPGLYFTANSVFGEVGKVYTLHVEEVDLLNDGNLTSYQAVSELKPVASPDSVKVVYQSIWDAWLVNVYAQDPPDTEDYYKFLVYQNGTLHSDSLLDIQYTDDAFFNGNYTNGISVYFVDGESEDTFLPGDSITVEFCGITQDYYKYLIEAQVSARPSVPLFSGPPANPRTNLTNGAVGYFAAYSVSRASTVIPNE